MLDRFHVSSGLGPYLAVGAVDSSSAYGRISEGVENLSGLEGNNVPLSASLKDYQNADEFIVEVSRECEKGPPSSR